MRLSSTIRMHLAWGQWISTNSETIEIPISNTRSPQTYYGAVNFQTQQFHLKAFPSGNGIHTVSYVKWLRQLYPDARLWLIVGWRQLSSLCWNAGLSGTGQCCLTEEEWVVTCLLFAPNAPQQNPVEDIWRKGKNWLRKRFAYNKTFADVKTCFFDYLQNGVFSSAKFDWYKSSPQII